MNTKRHFALLTKAMLAVIVFFCCSISYNAFYGTTVSAGKSRTEISCGPASVAGEMLIITSPCIPAAGVTNKNNSNPGQIFRDKGFIESAYYSPCSTTDFSSNNRRHFLQGCYSLRLHLVCRVLRI